MRLSKFSDYALRAALYVAAHNDRLVPIKEIVEAHDLSQGNLMKVVNALVEGGFLRSVRGRNGGVALARPAEDINVGDIVHHMEGTGALVDCRGCILVRGCGLIPVLREAQLSFYDTLNKYTLADALTLNPRSKAILLDVAESE